jgi:hypothetical protein
VAGYQGDDLKDTTILAPAWLVNLAGTFRLRLGDLWAPVIFGTRLKSVPSALNRSWLKVKRLLASAKYGARVFLNFSLYLVETIWDMPSLYPRG